MFQLDRDRVIKHRRGKVEERATRPFSEPRTRYWGKLRLNIPSDRLTSLVEANSQPKHDLEKTNHG